MRIYERKNILERNINYSNAYGRNLLQEAIVSCENTIAVDFEWKTNETFLVTYGHEGKIADVLYLGMNKIKPTFVKFSFNSKRHIPMEDIQRSKWVYYEQSKLLKLEVFEEISWLDKDQNPCLDNYYHTFFYRIDKQGRIVRLRKGKIVPYKYNHSDMPTTHILKQHINALHYNSLPIQKGT